MKPKPFTLFAAIILLNSVTASAGDGFLTKVGRNIGYGISDGYHAKRYCMSDYSSCSDCSAAQQPMMQQPMMQQPMIPQPEMQPVMTYQPMMPQPEMQPVLMYQPMMQQQQQQPMMVPVHAQSAPHQFQPTSYRVGYPSPQTYQPWYQPYATGYGQLVTPSVAIPNPRPAGRW